MIIDYRKNKFSVNPIKIQDQEVEIVDTYKYLGVVIDNRLNWAPHVDKVLKKTQSRLFFLRKLRSFNVCNRMLIMFYQTVVSSVMTYALVCWGGNAR